MEMGLNPDVEGVRRFGIGAGSGGGGGWWWTLGVNGLFGVEAEGGPSSVDQPPLLKPDEIAGGVMWSGSEGGGGGGGEGGCIGLEKAVHADPLKLPPEDELTADRLPGVNPNFFSDGAGPGSILVAEPRGFCTVLITLTTGVTVVSFTPAALAAFRSSLSSLFLSFSLRISIASWELALARSFNCISLNLILWWWAYELQCSSYCATFWNCFSHTVQ